MRHRVVVLPRAEKKLNKILEPYKGKIKLVFAWLENNPYIGKKLAGPWKEKWSYRAGPFRIIYQIRQKELVVLIIDIGDRKGIYR